MKLRLNKKVLAEMPAPVRALVLDWKEQHRKSFISVVNAPVLCLQEDAKVTMVNLLTNKQQTERVAGEFAGYTRLSPTADVTLSEGVVAVVTGFFCGHPWLTIYQASPVQIESGVAA